MRFLSRTMIGLFLLAATLAIIILAGGQIYWAMNEAAGGNQRRPGGRERIFAANVDTLTVETVTPLILTYGTVQSWRSMEIRASVGGTLVELSPEFRDGGRVSAGDLVFQVDPAKSRSTLALAENQLLEARAELGAAQAALTLTQAEVELAKTQRVLRVLALEREQNLRDRGIGTDATVETVTLTLSSADQTLLSRQSAVAQVETRISQAEISIQRNQISVEEARRILAETQIIAPFDGVLSDVSAMLGRLVSPNEQMAILIDPAALEVAFRVTNSQFARLVDSDGNLRPALVQVIFDRNDFPFEITTTLARTGAEVGDGQTGRLIYARLTGTAATVLLPGDFLTVLIEEPPIENVSIIPAAAVSSDGGLLIVGDDDRLSEITVTILRQQGDQVIVTGAPVGQEYVTAWSTQIGEGIQIRPLREDDAPTPASSPSTETMTLTDERRDQLIEFVNGNTRMPDQAKARILAQLSEPEVPVEVVTQLEDRMGG